MKNSFMLLAVALLSLAGCRDLNRESAFVIGGAYGIDGLYAPWDGLDDQTCFRCHADAGRFYFHYEVSDSTMTVIADYEGERTVDWEDRVEIFFSTTPDMDSYYCAEIDPLGRRMDYSSSYGKPLEYGWNFRTMRQAGQIFDGGYIVSGSVSRKELEQLGVDLDGGFWLGVFRADFHSDGSVNWYSAVSTDDESPYFHKPNVLFFAKIED